MSRDAAPRLRRAAAGLRRCRSRAFEGLVGLAARRAPRPAAPPRTPRSIFILRNNDFGDLLVVTPLFEALRRRFPEAVVAVGATTPAAELLTGNPHVSEVMHVDAPWFHRAARGRGTAARLLYLARSPQLAEVAARRFDVGIDVLGSAWGALLLLRAGIPYRLGVRGYAGGHSAACAWINYVPGERVGRMALRLAELLGARELPDPRPLISLSEAARAEGEARWRELSRPRRDRELPVRLVLAPGAGLPEKCWPLDRFVELARRLGAAGGVEIAVVGGPGDRAAGRALAAAAPSVHDLTGSPSVRGTLALVEAADGVLTNSSLALHVAAAFGKPALVLLGPSFDSVRRHDAQWGHPGCQSLGREEGERDRIATVEEAEAAARALFPGLRGRGARP